MASPIAVLASQSGTMQFYSQEALKVWYELEVALHMKLNPAPCAIALETGGEAMHEGFSLSDWVQYAKKKSHIATATSRLNGELKARLNQMNSCVSGVPGSSDVDPLSRSDPWLKAKPMMNRASTNATSDGASLWSGWGRKLSNEFLPPQPPTNPIDSTESVPGAVEGTACTMQKAEYKEQMAIDRWTLVVRRKRADALGKRAIVAKMQEVPAEIKMGECIEAEVQTDPWPSLSAVFGEMAQTEKVLDPAPESIFELARSTGGFEQGCEGSKFGSKGEFVCKGEKRDFGCKGERGEFGGKGCGKIGKKASFIEWCAKSARDALEKGGFGKGCEGSKVGLKGEFGCKGEKGEFGFGKGPMMRKPIDKSG